VRADHDQAGRPGFFQGDRALILWAKAKSLGLIPPSLDVQDPDSQPVIDWALLYAERELSVPMVMMDFLSDLAQVSSGRSSAEGRQKLWRSETNNWYRMRQRLMPWLPSAEEEMKKVMPEMNKSWEAAFGLKIGSKEYNRELERVLEGLRRMKS
jgi:hypothetical protein